MTADADIDDDAAQAEDEQPKKRGLSRRMLIIVAAGVGLLLAAGAGSYFLFFSSAKDPHAGEALATVPETFIDGLSRVERHRRVHAVLDTELQGRVHALALTLLTPDEASRRM
jgi:flagellar basal body-associated protein FliL